MPIDKERIDRLAAELADLSDAQFARIERIAKVFGAPAVVEVGDSDVITEPVAELLGETLQTHHLASAEPFTKDKFEYALVSALGADGHEAEKTERGNPGDDIKVDDVPWSLKTQADKSIKLDVLAISKFMELGKGKWEDEQDLVALRDRMFEHMKSYERIFSLRCLTPFAEEEYRYELVEIPKGLLQSAENFPCVMKHESAQNPKPGTCTVTDPDGAVLFELLFDGGTERKLTIKKLAKASCVVHATWTFPVPED